MSTRPETKGELSAWHVYIIKASDGSLYTGVTTDVQRRFVEHCGGDKGARFFRGRKPLDVVYIESHPDRSSAQRRESAIKKLSRDRKLELIGRVDKNRQGALVDK